LGEEKFNEIMKDYYETWKFKHPYPEDFENIIEKHVDEDMSWFFEDLIKTTKKLDYKIVRKKDQRVLVKNVGNIAGPVAIHEISGNKTTSITQHKGFEGKKWLKLKGDPEKVQLNQKYRVPELNQENNTLKSKGVFKKKEPLEIRLLGILEKSNRTTLNVFPAMGWNYYNGYMLGGLIYSDLLPAPELEYQIMPMYSFGSKDLAGSAKLAYHILPYSNVFQMISLYTSGRQFSYENEGGKYYQKLVVGANILFARKHQNEKIDNEVGVRYIYASDMDNIFYGSNDPFKQFYEIQYNHGNTRKAHPYNINVNVQGSDDFLKASFEANYRHHYIYKNTLDIRLFGGAFLYRDNEASSIYNFYSSGYNGLGDYTYDELFLARFEDPSSKHLLSNQFAAKHGALSVYSPFGQTDEWMMALNVASSLPVAKDIPIQFYANISTFGHQMPYADWEKNESVLFDGGVKIQVVRDIFEIYMPLFMSKDLKEYSDYATDTWIQNVRFTLNLNKLNPFDLVRKI
jgi:hypothetical protein